MRKTMRLLNLIVGHAQRDVSPLLAGPPEPGCHRDCSATCALAPGCPRWSPDVKRRECPEWLQPLAKDCTRRLIFQLQIASDIFVAIVSFVSFTAA